MVKMSNCAAIMNRPATRTDLLCPFHCDVVNRDNDLEDIIRQLKQQNDELKRQLVEARQQANYWKYQAGQLAEKIKELKQELEETQAKLNLRERQLFSKKSEKSAGQSDKNNTTSDQSKKKKKRGRQKGSQGHGRRDNSNLPEKVVEKDIPLDDRMCPCCGLPYEEFGDTEDSETIEIEVKAHRRVIKRKKYKKTCACPSQPGVITAPPEPKLIPKGKLGISIWVEVLLDKFMAMHPTNRLLTQWQLLGLDIPLSTVINGLKKIMPLFVLIYEAILEHNRQHHHWHADETRWNVFAEVEDKVGHRWYLWLFAAKSSVAYVLDPSRSVHAPEHHLTIVAVGILNVDRYASYKALARINTRIILAFCWAHVRRDFLAVGKDRANHEVWATSWVEDIGNLYHLNKQRLAALDQPDVLPERQAKLEQAVEQMTIRCEQELAADDIHPAHKKVLTSLKNHWDGLTVFVDHPDVPMDNNKAERTLRSAVIGRKNFYGSCAEWSGKLLAMLLSIIQTVLCWDINPRLWLTHFLTACAENSGQAPVDVSDFLPWNMTPEQRQQMSDPPVRPPNTS